MYGMFNRSRAHPSVPAYRSEDSQGSVVKRPSIIVQFTGPQADAVHGAILSRLEDEWLPPGQAQALVNAFKKIREAST